ncbi:MAG: hypothetical protein M4579_003930 [Chaenotheca gracillima]|nr:MAG: hypothetical protein M4579_003930 [Chaenotheca gracillima]
MYDVDWNDVEGFFVVPDFSNNPIEEQGLGLRDNGIGSVDTRVSHCINSIKSVNSAEQATKIPRPTKITSLEEIRIHCETVEDREHLLFYILLFIFFSVCSLALILVLVKLLRGRFLKYQNNVSSTVNTANNSHHPGIELGSFSQTTLVTRAGERAVDSTTSLNSLSSASTWTGRRISNWSRVFRDQPKSDQSPCGLTDLENGDVGCLRPSGGSNSTLASTGNERTWKRTSSNNDVFLNGTSQLQDEKTKELPSPKSSPGKGLKAIVQAGRRGKKRLSTIMSSGSHDAEHRLDGAPIGESSLSGRPDR